MSAARVLRLIVTLASLVSLAGCGASRPGSVSHALGRAFGAEAVNARAAPSPNGDPLPERGGKIPTGAARSANALAPGMATASAQAALYRYALAYTNWSASRLPTRERALVALSVGPARLQAQQSAASDGEAAALARDHVENHGVVLAISEGAGPAHGWWVVVTQERTTGTGPYAGLPEGPHVTWARVERLMEGWAIIDWRPRD